MNLFSCNFENDYSGYVFISHVFISLTGEQFVGKVFGHEISGVIEEFGKDVNVRELDLKVGDKVVVWPWIGCRQCNACLAGYNNECIDNVGGLKDIGEGENPGGFGSHVAVPEVRFVLKVPESIPMDIASLLPCSGSTSYRVLKTSIDALDHAYNINHPTPSRLLIIGAGGLGLWAIKLARYVIKEVPVRILVADINQEKLDMALSSGADEGFLLDPKDDTVASVAMVTKSGKEKIAAAIDFVGMPQSASLALESLSNGGNAIVVGLHGGEIPVSLPSLVGRSVKLQGSRVCTKELLQECLALVAEHPMDYPLEHCVLKDINKAISRVKAGQVTGRIVINFT